MHGRRAGWEVSFGELLLLSVCRSVSRLLGGPPLPRPTHCPALGGPLTIQ